MTSEGLIIRNIKKEDEGVYKCAASDLEAGEGIERDIKVEVNIKTILFCCKHI